MVTKSFPDDTITAISTPLGEGGLGVVRLSGPEAIPIADRIFRSKKNKSVLNQKSHTVRYGHVISRSLDGRVQVIDEALLLVMRSPRSYTSEDVVELSAHGGPAVLQRILELAVSEGARMAEKGEFTKRAFLNGRIDLLQAEAVLDLIQAKTEKAREWASAQLEGVLSGRMREMRTELLGILSQLEASIDFPDDFLDTESPGELGHKLEALSEKTRRLLSSFEIGSVAKRGLKVVLAGRPNVGKSSLMNQLVRANRVIVTPFPGTTRDVVEDEIQLNGLWVRLMDTAGIQESEHPIEKEGIQRSKQAVGDADLVLYVLDGSRPWHGEDERLLQDIQEKKAIIVINKSDLDQRIDAVRLRNRFGGFGLVSTSCIAENGIHELEEAISCFIRQGKAQIADEVVISSVRQKDLLEKAQAAIANAKTGCLDNLSPELVAVDVRLALDAIRELVGEVVTDDVLEVIFSQFCIGK